MFSSPCVLICMTSLCAQTIPDPVVKEGAADAVFPPSSGPRLLSLSSAAVALDEAEPARRALPAPFNSPPFPFSDYLGPTIGIPDTTPDWPLQKALSGTPLGEFLKENRIKVYGWVSPSFNWSTSKKSNSPEAYALVPNRPELDQLVFITERALDTVQTDHIDWGFHVLALYGIDYRYMIAKGFLSGQLLRKNELYGGDIPELDVRWYFPHVAEGMTLKIGRWISTPDIEACPTPVNYMFTHSIMFSIDPYTYFGVMADIRMNKNWTIELGVLGPNDVAPWDRSVVPNGHLMVKWVSDDNKDSIWGGINMLGEGKWKDNHDNLQHIVATWTHKFSDELHMLTEAYYMWQRDAYLGGSVNWGPVRRFGGGGGPGFFQPGLSDSWGIVNNFEIKLSDKDYLTIRNDMLRDDEGQRTAYRNTYTSHGIGWSHNVSELVTIRPELRYERGYNLPAYDNGTKDWQVMFAVDLIVRF
jgi:hypothetical protein